MRRALALVVAAALLPDVVFSARKSSAITSEREKKAREQQLENQAFSSAPGTPLAKRIWSEVSGLMMQYTYRMCGKISVLNRTGTFTRRAVDVADGGLAYVITRPYAALGL